MALTKSTFYANRHQPRLVVEAVLRDPIAVGLLRSLATGPLPLAAVARGNEERHVLRRLVRLDLVSAYTLDGVARYRLRRVAPYVREVMGRGVAA